MLTSQKLMCKYSAYLKLSGLSSMIRFFDLKIIGSDSKDVKYWSMKWLDDIAGFRFRKISLASERPKIVA